MGMAARSNSDDAPGMRHRVMVVDDNDLVLRLSVRALELGGYDVLQARSADEALATLESSPEPIDLLLTDIVLGATNGYELATQVLAKTPGIGLLVTSGYAAPQTLPPIAGASAVGFLQKPYTPAALTESVAALLPAA